jgi:predicted DNA-binding protein (MmcQ/YjbR family)
MPKVHDALSNIRAICLNLPNVDETKHFGQPAFRVKKKMFATCSDKTGTWRLQLQLKPESTKALLENDPRFQPYERMKSVISMEIEGVTNWNEVRSLILEGYEMIANASSKTKKAKSRKKTRST